MSIPIWVTPSGSLGTIPEGVFYSLPLLATADSTVYYKAIAGVLPPGVFIDETGILSGQPGATAQIEGIPFDVIAETTDTFVVRAYTQAVVNGITVVTGLADRTFSLTISNQSTVVWTTPSGNIGEYIDGTQINNLTLLYRDTSVYAADVVTLIAGSLPPGLSISPAGVISGYITPNPNASVVYTDYSFTLKVSNGVSNDVRTFNILVYARSLITADSWGVVGGPPPHISADNTFITADTTTTQPPIITTPVGSIGSTRSDNFYAFQFTGKDFNGNAFEFIALTSLPPGLTLDPNSGWLYGYIPYGGITYTTYDFSIEVREVDNIANTSDAYDFSLTITGPVNTDVVWLTPSDPVELAKDPSSLGAIDNGATSTFYILAKNVSGVPLQYQLVSGSNSRLPQGLDLLPSGHIAGRVSFNTFAVDSGTTTFDVGLNTLDQPTTFDMVAIFTVNAYSVNGLVSVDKTFSITVVRRYEEPYDNLYIQAMPPENDRALLSSLLQNPTTFPPQLIYRSDDPNFGISTRVIYNHAYGLRADTIDAYVTSLELNHYWKNLVLGTIKTARALDDNGNIIYEVVYSEVIDDLVNNQGVSVGKSVTLPFPINVNGTETQIVYPNSLQDMRDQVVDSVGQISNVLPRWMLSRQEDGSVLGFTPAWVIAYTNPGESGQIAYNIQNYFTSELNLIDFKADRYELDNFLTKNWNREEQYWGYTGDTVTPHPPSLTTFDIVGLPSFQPFRTTLLGAGIPAVNQTYTQIQPYRYVGTTDSDWFMYSDDFGNTWNIKYLLMPADYYTSTDLITWSVVAGVNPAPTASFYQVGDIVIYQTVETTEPSPYVYRDGSYRVSKPYRCIQNTTPGILPTDIEYWTDSGEDLIAWNLAEWENNSNVITTWEDNLQTLATWTYATPGDNNQGTTFDNNSLLFTAPVDMYSATVNTDYDRYLLFPKKTITQSLPQVNQVFWVNDYSELVAWVNNLDESVIWVAENA